MKQIAEEYRQEIRDHFEENRRAALEIKDYLEQEIQVFPMQKENGLYLLTVMTIFQKQCWGIYMMLQ